MTLEQALEVGNAQAGCFLRRWDEPPQLEEPRRRMIVGDVE